jgi:hypothetical protein
LKKRGKGRGEEAGEEGEKEREGIKVKDTKKSKSAKNKPLQAKVIHWRFVCVSFM